MADFTDTPRVPANVNARFQHQEIIILGCRAVMEYAGRDAQPGDAVGLFWTLHDSQLGPEAAIAALGELAWWMTEAELLATLETWLAKARERQVIAAHVTTCEMCGATSHDWPAIRRALDDMRKSS